VPKEQKNSENTQHSTTTHALRLRVHTIRRLRPDIPQSEKLHAVCFLVVHSPREVYRVAQKVSHYRIFKELC